MRRVLLGFMVLWLMLPAAWADTDVSNSTLSVTPTAVAGTTITAAHENSRNSTITTWANAHLHRLANTTSFGDGAAGNKTFCADAGDAVDRCLRFDDTANVWTMDQLNPSTFGTIIIHSGTSALTNNAFLISAGLGIVDDAAMTVGATLPAVFGDFSARVTNTAALPVASGTATILTFDSERWDTDTIHSTSSNTGRLTATTAGKYQITGHVEFSTGGTGQRYIGIYLNGTTVIARQDCSFTGAAGFMTSAVPCSITTHYNLTAAQYVELRAFQTVGATLNINVSADYSPEFEMVKVP